MLHPANESAGGTLHLHLLDAAVEGSVQSDELLALGKHVRDVRQCWIMESRAFKKVVSGLN